MSVPWLASLHHRAELVLPVQGAAQRTHKPKQYWQSSCGPKHVHETLPSINSEATRSKDPDSNGTCLWEFLLLSGAPHKNVSPISIKGLHGTTVFSSFQTQGLVQAGSTPWAPTCSHCHGQKLAFVFILTLPQMDKAIV